MKSHDAGTWALLESDCVAALRMLGTASIDSVVCDPPYELGFMGKTWDASGIAYSVDLWREVLRVLKPGGHLLAFGGTRTYHRMACAIEDAGFEVRDCLTWNYKTGFPKSVNLGEGRGSALKPSIEPIVVARKTFKGTLAGNVAAHGTGGLNIDRCRIGTETVGWGGGGRGASDDSTWNSETTGLKAGDARPVQGRWPANSLYDDSFPEIEKFFFCAKPSRVERDRGCEHLPPKTGGEATDRTDDSIGTENPRAGAGRTGGARNYHPTVKPIQLMRYLCRLVTPPGGIVLDPFTGSGTTGIAALEEGFRFLGIEREPEYFEIARLRIGSAA